MFKVDVVHYIGRFVRWVEGAEEAEQRLAAHRGRITANGVLSNKLRGHDAQKVPVCPAGAAAGHINLSRGLI